VNFIDYNRHESPGPTVQDQTWFGLVAAMAAALVVVTGFVALAVGPGGTAPVRIGGAVATDPTVYRNLTIAYDPSAGDYAYSTSQLSVPLGQHVIFTITNYDPQSSHVPAPMYDQVLGTSGGSMSISTAAGTVSASSLPPSEVSHTFTVWDGSYHLNVPIPTAGGNAAPVRVTFSVTFNTPGSFTFGCVAYCPGADMSSASAMYGTLSVS
jgi:plastocyanin